MEHAGETVELTNAVGRVSREYVYLYPPGIPILVPGERIDAGFVSDVGEMRERGLMPEGMRDKQAERIDVLK